MYLFNTFLSYKFETHEINTNKIYSMLCDDTKSDVDLQWNHWVGGVKQKKRGKITNNLNKLQINCEHPFSRNKFLHFNSFNPNFLTKNNCVLYFKAKNIVITVEQKQNRLKSRVFLSKLAYLEQIHRALPCRARATTKYVIIAEFISHILVHTIILNSNLWNERRQPAVSRFWFKNGTLRVKPITPVTDGQHRSTKKTQWEIIVFRIIHIEGFDYSSCRESTDHENFSCNSSNFVGTSILLSAYQIYGKKSRFQIKITW